MLRAEELRLGNFIELRSLNSDFIRFIEIKDWSIEKANIHHLKDLYQGNKDWEYRSIAITEEWLLSFGFISTEKNYGYQLALNDSQSALFRG